MAVTLMIWGQGFSEIAPILPMLLVFQCPSYTNSHFCGLSPSGRNNSRPKFLSWTLYLFPGFHVPLTCQLRGLPLIVKIAATLSLNLSLHQHSSPGSWQRNTNISIYLFYYFVCGLLLFILVSDIYRILTPQTKFPN